MKRIVPLALLVMMAPPAVAQTQSAMNADAARQARASDQALNAQYAGTMAKLSPASRLMLRDAQRSWIGFRDLQCKFESSGTKGGTAYPMVLSACTKRLTDDRTRQLKTYAQCEEGDLSCPR